MAQSAYLRVSFKSLDRLNSSGLTSFSRQGVVNGVELLVCCSGSKLGC